MPTDEQGFVTLAVQQDGPARTDTFQGRPHRVIPAVLVQEQVLHNNLGRMYLPAEEITDEWAATFNGAPVLVDHPHERGTPVAARNNRPVLDTMGVGFIDNARADGPKVRGEVWLDEARATSVPDLTAVFARIDAGEKNELSTGFPLREMEVANGQFDGRDYEVIGRPGPGDHLAVFATKRGACSVTDGCGLGVNHAGPCHTEEAVEEPITIDIAGQQLSVPADVPAEGIIARAKAWLAGLFGTQESDNDRRELLRAALTEQFGGENVFLWIADVFSEEGYLVYERETEDDSGLFRVDFEVSDEGAVTLSDPTEVRRETSFKPVSNTGDTPPQEGTTMNREQMIAHLAEGGRPKEALNALSDCDLKALMGTPSTPADPPADTHEEQTWQERATRYRRELEELKHRIEPAMNREAEERVELLEDLLYKGRRVEWSENELKAMDIAELRKVHRQVTNSADFSGRGGPRFEQPVGNLDWCVPMSDALREGVN